MPTADWSGRVEADHTSADGVSQPAAGEAAVAVFDRAEELSAYRDMLLIRRFEEKAGQLYGMGDIGGFCHLCIGQEAVTVGLKMAMMPGDQVVATYRDHGSLLACGVPPREIMAELTGRSGGVSRGKGGSMHMFAPEHGFYGGHGIVGAPVPIGAGIAFANRYRNDGRVCWCTFGDAAADQGQVAETMTMAAAWMLPIVFVIENNMHAAGSTIERSESATALAARGRAYGIPGEQVDGMDVRAVRAAGIAAAARARAGKGPVIVEMLTYCYRGHSMAAPGKYTSKEDMRAARERYDPLEQIKARVLLAQLATEDDLKAIDKEVRAIVNDAARFALSSPEPEAREMWTDVVT